MTGDETNNVWLGEGTILMESSLGHYARQLTEEEISFLKRDTEVLSDFKRDKLEKEAKKNWDLFFKRNTTHFFKDRHWITREFPEILQAISELDHKRPVLLEAGCGVGNTVFPLLEENSNLFVFACDFSPRAIDFVKVSMPPQNNRLFEESIICGSQSS